MSKPSSNQLELDDSRRHLYQTSFCGQALTEAMNECGNRQAQNLFSDEIVKEFYLSFYKVCFLS